MKKQIYYYYVNDSSQPIPFEAYDIMDFNTIISFSLKTPPQYIKILSQRDNILSVFSILDYLVTLNQPFSLVSFNIFLSHIQQYIQVPTDTLSITTILWLWFRQFSPDEIQQPTELEPILSKYDIPIDSSNILEEYQDWTLQFDQELEDISNSYDEMVNRINTLLQYPCPLDDITPFTTRKTRVQFFANYTHSLFHLLDNSTLSENWIVGIHSSIIRVHRSVFLTEQKEQYIEQFEEIFSQDLSNTLLFYANDLDQSISISKHANNSLHILLDIQPFEDIGDIRTIIEQVLGIPIEKEYKTISVAGTFYIKNTLFEKLIFQDFIMNDEIASYYFYINELEKATRFGENVTLHYNNTSAILINSTNDTSPLPPILSYFRGNYIKINITKTEGQSINHFQEILCIILHRFKSLYTEYQSLYTTLLPNLPTFPSLEYDISSTEDLTNFSIKYKNVFKRTGYKTSCRPKSRVPTIISSTEARELNPLRVIKYPKENDENIDIPSEYLTCKDPEYQFPGIVSLSGGSLFVPCCFNKNPRSSRAFLEYYSGETRPEPRGTDHLKSETQIIKTFGDVGRLPSIIHKFMIALNPTTIYFRSGTIDSPNSILYSLYEMTNRPRPTSNIRQELIDYFGTNLSVCLQENMDRSITEIMNDLSNDTTYLDPRRYIRLFEIFFNVNLILFYKSKKTEMIEIMTPNFQLFPIRYDFDVKKPFVFLYEHWGTSPDRYTKRSFPVCEIIFSSVPTKTFQFTFTSQQSKHLTEIYRTIFNLYPLLQNTPILPTKKEMESQSIDDNGKMRGLFIRIPFINKLCYFENTQPLPPIYIPNEIQLTTLTSIYIPRLQEINIPNMTLSRLLQYESKKYAIFQYLGYDWKIEIRAPNSSDFQRINLPLLVSKPPLSISPRHSFPNINKQQLSRILIDYTLYLYSKFSFPSLNFNSFFQKHTIITPNYIYPKTFSEMINENPLIYNLEKELLILDSKETKEKLSFQIQYYLTYEYDVLETFHTNTILPHFWKVPYDFQNWREMYYTNVFERLFKHNDVVYALDQHSLSLLQKPKGYWYEYKELPIKEWNYPFRYVKVEDEQEAIALTLFWRKYRYIPSYKIGMIETENKKEFYYSQGKWDRPNDFDVMKDEPIFIVRTDESHYYVLLEIKN